MSLFQKIFQRYLHNRVTGDERKMVDGWYHAYDDQPEIHLGPEEENAIAHSLWQKLSVVPYSHSGRQKPAASLSVAWRWYGSAAAALIITGLSWFFFKTTGREKKPALAVYETHARQYKKLQLPDGSTLHLHPASAVSFTPAFDQPDREVWMPEGEIYYSVAKDSARPFIIHAGQLEVKVVGTAFCIRTIRGIQEQEVVVKSGRVLVKQGNRVLGELTAGNRLVYDSVTHRYLIEKEKGMLAAQLENGWFVLNNTSFTGLQVQFRNRYNIQVEDRRHKLKDAHFTAAFPPQATIRHIIEVLTSIHQVNYRLEGQQVIID